MNPEQAKDAELLWQFANEVYARPRVATLCLRLQDEHRVDVNVLLYAVWASDRGRSLQLADLQTLVGARSDWSREVVEPLRETRRRWKSARDGSAEYEAVKAVELAAEREELRLLAGVRLNASRRPVAAEDGSGKLLRANLDTLCKYYSLSAAGRAVVIDQLSAALDSAC